MKQLSSAIQAKQPSAAIRKDIFRYSLDFGSIAAGQTVTRTLQFERETDFEWLKSSYMVNILEAVQTVASKIIPQITVNMKDATGRNFEDIGVDLSLMAGDGSLPHINAIPRFFKRAATLTISMTNYHTVTTYDDVKFVMHGVKIFGGQDI